MNSMNLNHIAFGLITLNLVVDLFLYLFIDINLN